jgi:large subunit ribosomal protein L9
MDVILLERIENLGQIGETVKVRPGFARNYLLPQKKALRATEANQAAFEKDRARLEAEDLKRRTDAEALSARIDGLNVVMIRQAGDSGQLYGSVSARDVAEAVSEKSEVPIERSHVALDKPIKTLGLHDVRIRLHADVGIGVIVNVARSEAEAEIQAQAGRTVSVEEQRQMAEAASEEIEEILAEADAAEEAKSEDASEGAESPEAEEEKPA